MPPTAVVRTGGRRGPSRLLASIVLTAVPAALLMAMVLPGQHELLMDAPVAEHRSAATRLAMTTGIFNLLWATVVVLMIVRPGSTTGA